MPGDKESSISRRTVLRSGVTGLAGISLAAQTASADPEGPGSDLRPSDCTSRGIYYVYLDGSCEQADGNRYKTYPDDDRYDGEWREWQSPLRNETVPAGYYRSFSSVEMARARHDTRALNDLNLPAGMKVSLINIKRDADGTPFYRYFTTEDDPDDYESWSASKFMAIAAAASKIRHNSSNDVGIDSRIEDGPHVGELVSYVHNYEGGGNLDSNRLAKYFLNVAGKDWATELVEQWTGSIDSTFRGGYGKAASDFPYTFVTDDARVSIRNAGERGGDKKMTTLGMAEFLKRLVMHREDPATRVPGFRADADHEVFWNDLQVLFYGQPSWHWGGMSDDTAIYLESAVDLDDLADGQWRIFSKLGYGRSGWRNREEFVYNGYACFPDADDPTSGSEFVISIHYSLPTSARSGDRMDRDMQSAIERIVEAIHSEEIDDLAGDPSQAALRDVENHWAESEIRTLVEEGVLSGYPDGTIRPDTTITRAEFATLLDNAFDPDSAHPKNFDDIQGHWAADAIRNVAGAGFFAGFGDGSFHPDEPVTKTQALVALVGGAGLSRGDPSVLDYRDSHKVPDWAAEAVAGAVEAGWVENFPLEEWFEPKAAATRGEVLKYIYQATR